MPRNTVGAATGVEVMRSFSGFVLLAGVGVGLFVYLPAPVDRHISLDQARRNAELTIAEKRPSPAAPTQASGRTFAPKFELASLAATGSHARPVIIKVPNDTGLARSGWQTSASVVPSQDDNAPVSRYDLVIDIQKQLKRLGCYYGRVDGSWGPATKSAVSYFNGRVNAALPSETPDPILLTLLKAHDGKTCGSCPVGQTASTEGRCVAQTAGYGSQSAPHRVAVQETLPWQGSTTHAAQAPAAQPLFRPVPTSVVSTEPLPGRMAIGAPRTLPSVDSANAQPNYNAYSPQSGTTAVAAQDGVLGADTGPAPSASPPKRRSKSSKRSSGRGRPGTPRYNLMLSLGGVY